MSVSADVPDLEPQPPHQKSVTIGAVCKALQDTRSWRTAFVDEGGESAISIKLG